MSLLFVYGTLMRGGTNHDYLARETFLGRAESLPGFVLYRIADFPGLIAEAAGSGFVSGEVWSVSPPAIEALDILEGVAEGLYARQLIPLRPPFHEQNVQSYFYLRSLDGKERMGGAWRHAG